MKKFFVRLLKRITKSLEEDPNIVCPEPETPAQITIIAQEQEVIVPPEVRDIPPKIIEDNDPIMAETKAKKATAKTKTKSSKGLAKQSFDPRDIMEVMEVPFLALSKNRKTPINYESPDGRIKVKVSCHTGHYVASIYDWDIIQFIAGMMQEIINSGSDIPPKTLTIPRNKLLKAIHKHAGKTTANEIEASLSRLQLTGIETTIRNEDQRYRSGFSFLDNWRYTDRKDVKEFRITLSEWLYDGICSKGSMLKVSPDYFKITSGLKKFLYRTARKHVGKNENSWDFSIEKLYEKSGSEQELRKFKHDLKKVVSDNDIPGYFIKWMERDGKEFIRFQNHRGEFRKMLEE